MKHQKNQAFSQLDITKAFTLEDKIEPELNRFLPEIFNSSWM